MDELELTVARSERLLDIGRADEALELLNKDTRTVTDPAAMVTLARCFYRLDRDRDALDAAERSAGLDPDQVGAWIMIALSKLSMGLPVDALPPAKRAVQLAPWHAGTHSVTAKVLAELGRFPSATIHAHKTMELDPDGTIGWITLCRVQLAQQRWEQAEMSARQALGRDPENDEAKVLLGLAQVSSSRPGGRSEAMETLVETLRNNPDQDGVRKFLIEVALHHKLKTRSWVWFILLAIFTRGLALLFFLVMWTVTMFQLRASIPPDVRALVWADRASRYKIIAVTTLIGGLWLLIVGGVIALAIFNSEP